MFKLGGHFDVYLHFFHADDRYIAHIFQLNLFFFFLNNLLTYNGSLHNFDEIWKFGNDIRFKINDKEWEWVWRGMLYMH